MDYQHLSKQISLTNILSPTFMTFWLLIKRETVQILDLAGGFHQIPVDTTDQENPAFWSPPPKKKTTNLSALQMGFWMCHRRSRR